MNGLNQEEIFKKMRILEMQKELLPTKEMIKSEDEIAKIREAGRINTLVLDKVSEIIGENVSTESINLVVDSYTRELGGIPAPLNYEGYPKSCCISINNQVCHGIPSEKVFLRSGDIVNVDCTTIVDGYYGDASRMFEIGKVHPKAKKLIQVTKECLDLAVKEIVPYKTHLEDIGFVILRHAKKHGFSVVLEVGGHGVGREFHEDPFVCHAGKKGAGILLVPGMTFTIEPMINAGKKEVFIDEENDWTIYTADGSLSAQVEYTIAILENGVEILSK